MNFDINIAHVLTMYLCLLFSLSVHEAAHAAMANYCGDPTARLLGRLTLNPVKHADPLGTVILPLVMMLWTYGFLFGWAKPVPFNPRNLNNMRRDPVFIALAGPVSNLLIAVACAIILRILVISFGVGAIGDFLEMFYGNRFADLGDAPPVVAAVGLIIGVLFVLNVVLLLFNLIPLPPLDGHHVLEYFLPPDGQRMLQQIGPFGILFAVLIAGPWIDFGMRHALGLLFSFIAWGHG